MIYFRNNGNEREKYLITFDTEKINDLKVRIALNCGEKSIKKEEVRFVPRSFSFSQYDDEIHYYGEVHSKLSKNKGKEWDRYEEYEVNLYDCEYIDYLCPSLVQFINQLYYDKKAINKLFDRDIQDICIFPKVKDKILMLQEEIASVSQSYMDSKRKRVEELNKKYADLTQNKEDIESQIKKLHIWTSKTQKELLDMDKVHTSKIEELNNRLKYFLSIEELNRNQEDMTGYIGELYSLVDIRLIDKISLNEIKRVREFQSEKIEQENEIHLLKKLQQK